MPINHLYSIWYQRLLQLRPSERITRLRNLAWLISAIFSGRSVQLGSIATKIPARVNLLSVIRRLSRWLDNPAVRVRDWYEPIARDWLESATQTLGEIRLIADGTKVGFGHQLLVVTLAFRHRAIPIAWTWMRASHGHSSACKQLALLAYVHRLMNPGTPVSLVGDTEFEAGGVQAQLQDWGWTFVLRQKPNNQVRLPVRPDARDRWRNFGSLVSQPGEWVWWEQAQLTTRFKRRVNLLAYWAVGEKEPWLLATHLPTPRETLDAYARRMWVEEMFGDLKAKGFDLESTHLHTCARLSRLTLAVALLYTWLMDLGPKIIKNGLRVWVDRAERRDLSLFQIAVRLVDRRLTDGLPIRFVCPIGCSAKLSGS